MYTFKLTWAQNAHGDLLAIMGTACSTYVLGKSDLIFSLCFN